MSQPPFSFPRRFFDALRTGRQKRPLLSVEQCWPAVRLPWPRCWALRASRRSRGRRPSGWSIKRGNPRRSRLIPFPISIIAPCCRRSSKTARSGRAAGRNRGRVSCHAGRGDRRQNRRALPPVQNRHGGPLGRSLSERAVAQCRSRLGRSIARHPAAGQRARARERRRHLPGPGGAGGVE